MDVVKEGEATIRVGSGVFYNPRMEGLRTLSVAFLRASGCAGKSVLDATSATGVRAIRYSRECGTGQLTALDINRKAYALCKKNISSSGVEARVLNTSIRQFSARAKETFDIIDLDPFGSPAPYLYDIMRLSHDGTILMATATDTAVLCGAHANACIKQYGSRPLHNELCKEVGIRILYWYIARVAAEFDMGMVPMLAVSDMHYMRVFLRLNGGAVEASESMKRNGTGGFCNMCGNFRLWESIGRLACPECGNCGAQMEGFGPLWTGRLHDRGLLRRIRCRGSVVLRTIKNEPDVPMFYSVPAMTSRLGIGSVSHYGLAERLAGMGFRASPTQFDSDGIKTDAPAAEVARAIKALVKE